MLQNTFGSGLAAVWGPSGRYFGGGGVAQIFDFLTPRYMFLTDPAKVQVGVTDGRTHARTDGRTEAPTI